MKRVFTLLAAIFFAGYCMGQEMLNMNFTGVSAMPPSGWTIDAQAGNWKISNTSNAGGVAPEAKLTWTPQFNTTTRLISPNVDMSGKTKALIQLRHMVDHYGSSYTIGVATRKEGGAWTNVWTKNVTASVPAELVSVVVENTDVNSSTFQFCIFFTGNSYNLNDWYIDNINLFAPYNVDAGISALNVPNFFVGAVPVKGTVNNFGVTAITSLKMKYQINDGAIVTEDFTGLNVAFGASYNYQFAENINLTPGSYNLKVWIAEVNGVEGDDNAANDMIQKTVSIPSQAVARRPFFESFTSSTCPPCYTFNTTFFNNFTTTNADQITLVKYQMNWPGAGDPYYNADGGIRRTLYGVSGVPALYVDGLSTGTNSGAVNAVFTQQLAAPAYIAIDGFHKIDGTTIEVVANINPYVDLTNMTAHIAVFENLTTGNVGSNGETSFKHVMMKMIPTGNGTTINTIDGQLYQLRHVVNLAGTKVEQFDDLNVALFVQDNSSKYIMQSNYSTEKVLPYYTVEFSKVGEGFTNLPEGTLYFYENGTVGLSAVPAEGATFQKWVINGTDVTDANYQFEITENTTVQAVFEGGGAQVYAVNISVEGQGSVDPAAGSHSVNAGESITITATPDADNKFVKYVVNGTDNTENPLTVTVTEDLTIVAHFQSTLFAPIVQSNMELNVYPNPTSGRVVAAFGSAYENLVFRLINNQGQTIREFERKSVVGGAEVEMNIENMPAGIYFLQITSGENTGVYKISLQK